MNCYIEDAKTQGFSWRLPPSSRGEKKVWARPQTDAQDQH